MHARGSRSPQISSGALPMRGSDAHDSPTAATGPPGQIDPAVEQRIQQLHQAIKTQISQLDHKIDGFTHRQETQFDEHDHRFDDIDKRFDDVDKRFEDVDKRFDDIDKRFEDVDKRFDDIDKRFEDVDKRFDEHGQRLDNHERRLVRIEHKLDYTSMSVENLEAREANRRSFEAMHTIRPVSYRGQFPKSFPSKVHAFWNIKVPKCIALLRFYELDRPSHFDQNLLQEGNEKTRSRDRRPREHESSDADDDADLRADAMKETNEPESESESESERDEEPLTDAQLRNLIISRREDVLKVLAHRLSLEYIDIRSNMLRFIPKVPTLIGKRQPGDSLMNYAPEKRVREAAAVPEPVASLLMPTTGRMPGFEALYQWTKSNPSSDSSSHKHGGTIVWDHQKRSSPLSFHSDTRATVPQMAKSSESADAGLLSPTQKIDTPSVYRSSGGEEEA